MVSHEVAMNVVDYREEEDAGAAGGIEKQNLGFGIWDLGLSGEAVGKVEVVAEVTIDLGNDVICDRLGGEINAVALAGGFGVVVEEGFIEVGGGV